MALQKDMKLYDMKKLLNEDLKEQILFDIFPILNLDTSQGGYFGVTRQILCMVDFLGALYSGFDNKKDLRKNNKGKVVEKKIASTKKALNFITEIMSQVDENYEKNGKYLYKMYRHGLVHLYQPKDLEINGRKLSWLPNKVGREKETVRVGDRIYKNVTHLEPLVDKYDQEKSLLPISIKCLYYDLISSIDIYMKELETKSKLRNNWKTTVNEIIKPEQI